MNLAVFVDQVYWRDQGVYSTDESYILFPLSFATVFEEVVFIGRVAPLPGRRAYALNQPGVGFCPIPYYDSVWDLSWKGPRMYRELRQVFQANLHQWDVVWVTGPNPVAHCLARQCQAGGRPYFLVVRQNLIEQMRNVHRGIKGWLALNMARLMEWRFQHLARNHTVFVMGQEMMRAYQAVTARTHMQFPSLITQAQLQEFASMPRRPAMNRLLCVGRLSPEKGHRYLLAALAELRARGLSCTLDVIGSGPLQATLQSEAVSLGVNEHVKFHGYVPFGPTLFGFYQNAAAVVVPSLSEGLPQVIAEALAIGVPTVATTVGGIPSFLTHGKNAILVPPADSQALADALGRLLLSADLQTQLGCRGQSLMRAFTMEFERENMAQIIHSEILTGHPSKP